MTGRRSRQRALQILGEPDAILPGGIVVRIYICLPSLRQGHGPYLQWSYTRENKRFTRWLSAEQEERYRSRINAARKLRELVSDLERLGIRSVEREEGWGT